MVEAISTETGKRLAAAAQEVPPRVWWDQFAKSYSLPKAPGTADQQSSVPCRTSTAEATGRDYPQMPVERDDQPRRPAPARRP